MAFLQKMKNVFANENTDINEKENINKNKNIKEEKLKVKEDKSIIDISIEKSLLALKKYYDIKVKSIDKLANVDPEWNFFDEYVQKNKIERIKLKINDKNKEKVFCDDEIEKTNKEIESLNESYKKNNLQIKKLSDSNSEKEKNALIEKGKAIYDKKKECYEKRKTLIDESNNIKGELKELNFTYIVELSYIEGKYKECEIIKKEYNIMNSFTEKALLAIKEYEQLNYDIAIKYAKEYFEFFNNEKMIIHTPIVDGLYIKSLIDEREYEKAKTYIEYLLKGYPDSIDLHKLIKRIHENLNESWEANLEEEIINILEK